MAFGPLIPGGSSGGGGSSFAPVTLTGTTASIDESTSVDLDIALPAGITRFYVVGARVARTAGASVGVAVRLYPTDARDTDDYSMVFGNQFAGVDIAGSTIHGPRNTTGGNLSRAGIAMTSDGEFARLTVANTDFAEVGTFQLHLDLLPLE